MSAQPAPERLLTDASRWREVKRVFHGAVDLCGQARAEFLRAASHEPEVIEQVESLLRAHKSAKDFISQPALIEAGVASKSDDGSFGASIIGKSIGPYQIIRELGRGGMGSVFLAIRGAADFNQQVALKIIKRGMDTDAILQRFVIERQILANLQHPNIAGFLDGGTTSDGLPFFVMEYVDGEPITKYCDANELDTSARLELFQKTCAAVRYAHQNLIVHRDLKPSNILVTRDGIPKLLDFGIAKILSSDQALEAETATAFRLMTPEYASPEQIRGLSITTATDVYSLGVVLYELLSGHRPLRFPSRAPDEVARVILNTEPVAPSEMASTGRQNGNFTSEFLATDTNHSTPFCNPKSLRGDLDNVVLKALRKERERRYASVLELSEDIRRHLAGLPVTARPDTFTYRAGKFIQRHRTGVAVAALVIVALLSATMVTSYQSYVARREHATAQLRSAEQRKLASSLINEVQTSLKEVPHSLPAQRMLAQKSFDYLNNLAKDAGDDPQFLGELADAYRNLGYLQAWTLQDNPNALLTFERARDLIRKRLAIEPNSYAARRALGDVLGNKIESLNLMQRTDEVAATYAEKLPLELDLANEDPRNSQRLMSAAETSESYGETLRSIEHYDEAGAKFQTAIEMGERAVDLLKGEPASPQQQVDLSLMEEKLAEMYEQIVDFSPAEKMYREAVATSSAVHAEHPEIVQALRNTTSSHWYLGKLLDRQGDHQGALDNYRAALKTVLDATAVDPTVDLPRGGEIKYSIVVGRALCKLNQKEEGVKLIRHGVELMLSLVESEKGNRGGQYWATEEFGWAVEGLAAAGVRDEAKTLSLKMIDWANEAAENAPQDGGPRLRLASIYEQLGDVYAGYDADTHKISTSDRARVAEAQSWYRKGIASVSNLSEEFAVSKVAVQTQQRRLEEKQSECAQRFGSKGNGP
ncbi:MAG TPA: serine/threonine-protein kinase [Pyrinomonadaceae bacterium]|jgi:non-specific serine/threonine protein kinase/serine/threonine-protein kinase|nr:serine/threonine-protein kinase [Pyrinomonadaceae bacterium]